MQIVIEERADARQRETLRRIIHGEDTKDMSTMWWVYSAMSDTHHPTLYKPINFEIDIEGRRAAASIPGLLETEGRPIKSPVSGHPHRVRIDMPGGIEFDVAEIGSGSATTSGAIAFMLKDSYGQFNRLHHHSGGVIR